MEKQPTYDYMSAWKTYAYEEEEQRFLFSSEEDLLKICDCVDLNKKNQKKVSGGIPIHYENDKLYVLKEGPHTRVCGESGSKKSRTICRGSAISAILNGDSFILTDPKGEIAADTKIQYLLKKQGHKVHILDFRTFDKDGFNCLAYIADMKGKGKEIKAMSAIERFVGMLVNGKKTQDDFWNDQAGDLIKSPMQFTLNALAEKGELENYHLATIQNFIRQDKSFIRVVAEKILKKLHFDGVYNPMQVYSDILENPEKTYACIVSSANALLSSFFSSEGLLKMLSIQTFEVREFYRQPTALFLVIPDEVSAYDMLVGYLIDTMYQILVDEYSEEYQNKKQAFCNIKIICDEVASIRINDMANKISASRSRQIDWTLIYQSDKQMQQAYEKDFGTICGNCKHNIFLGSSDYEILKGVSEQTGRTNISTDGRSIPMVSVEDLRRMKKERTFKEALVMTGNYIYCAKLPDYDVFPFLKNTEPILWKNQLQNQPVKTYTPKDLLEDFQDGIVTLCSSKKPQKYTIYKAERKNKEEKNTEKELQKKFEDFVESFEDDENDYDDFFDDFDEEWLDILEEDDEE